MSKKGLEIAGGEKQPSYVGWRGDLLAELALSRIPGLFVTRRPDRPDFDLRFDFLVATETGFCFFVAVKAFSSAKSRNKALGQDEEWPWQLKTTVNRRARERRSPFLLFLFDADTDDGRFVRLDSLPAPDQDTRLASIRFPARNVINRENLEAAIRSLQIEKAS